MADSDDEYDRKRRDKFRGERSGTGAAESNSYRGSDRREERSRGRDDWTERENWQSRSRGGRSGPDYREYRGGNSRGYSPVRGEGPQSKRMRPDWPMEDRRYSGVPHDNYGYGGWGHDHYGHHPAHPGYGHHNAPPAPARDGGPQATAAGDTQPAMMTFKTFLAAQEDSITVEDAIKKYNEYKLEFRRQQLNEFFVTHKDEEWFKIKYHPEESVKRKEEQLTALKSRLNVFLELLESGELTQITVDMDQQERLIRLLDTVVIKLEGGGEDDLKGLDESAAMPLPAPQNIDKTNDEKPVITVDLVQVNDDKEKESDEKTTEETKQEEPEKEEKASPLTMDIDPHHVELIEQAKIFSRYNAGAEPEVLVQATQGEEQTGKSTKRKRMSSAASRSGSSSSTGSSSSSSSSSSEDEAESTKGADNAKGGAGDKIELDEQPAPPGHMEEQPATVELKEEDEKKVGEEEDRPVQSGSPILEVPDEGNPEKVVVADQEPTSATATTTSDPAPVEKKEARALHKTTSIFLRNLSPAITRAEVEAMCKRYGGFLRVALADPLPERRWFRRGWVTFCREVNIKDICWNLNNIRLRDCELGAIVNRDLMRRIRPVTGVALHSSVVRADARLAARLAHHLDGRAGLWDKKLPDEGENGQLQNFSLNSSNPVLHKITEHLIEEESAEEEELLGLNKATSSEKTEGAEDEPATVPVERDVTLTAVLDKLILYLRIVHSVDYYNHCEYPYEDEMPNRCGIMHARASAPAKVTMNEITDYIKSFESKMCAFLSDAGALATDELTRLGIKDAEAEVEKFITANTQELAKDKWLCPLSGKKFKGPDFIRKHIFNKHGEKVEEVRKEVEYFNNYLRDVKRPQLAEHPSSNGAGTNPGTSRRDAPAIGHHGMGGVGGRGGGGGAFGFGGAPYYAHPYAPYAPPHVHHPRHMRAFGRGRGGGGSDFRPIIHYRDLDAPREAEDFA